MPELWRHGASELAGMIRAKEVSSREVVEAHLARIEAVNPAVNAVTVVLAETALAAADAADDARAGGERGGALAGVPITVKENVEVAGSAITQGLVAFEGMLPPADAPHVAQLRAAGAIPFARTNLPDFGMRWHTDNALHGATRNPWDASRTPGGSSGGEAAALATGMTPLGLGNDYGGSLRVPSQFCGTAALKPTYGRIADHRATLPAEPPITLQLFAVEGPMARHVQDLRLAFEAMCGPDPRDRAGCLSRCAARPPRRRYGWPCAPTRAAWASTPTSRPGCAPRPTPSPMRATPSRTPTLPGWPMRAPCGAPS